MKRIIVLGAVSLSIIGLCLFGFAGFSRLREFEDVKQNCINKVASNRLMWTIALKPSEPIERVGKLGSAVSRIDGVDQVQLVSAEQVLHQFKNEHAGEAQIIEAVERNHIFGPRVVITFKESVDLADEMQEGAIRAMIAEMGLNPESIYYENSGIKELLRNMQDMGFKPSLLKFMNFRDYKKVDTMKDLFQKCEVFGDQVFRPRQIEMTSS